MRIKLLWSSKRRANAYGQESKTIAEYCANVNTKPLFGDSCGKLCITKIASSLMQGDVASRISPCLPKIRLTARRATIGDSRRLDRPRAVSLARNGKRSITDLRLRRVRFARPRDRSNQ